MFPRFTHAFVCTVFLALGATTIPLNIYAGEQAVQSEEASVGNQDLATERTLAEIENLKRTIENLEKRIGDSKGISQKILDSRLIKARLNFLEQGLSFARIVNEQEEAGTKADEYRKRAIEILGSQIHITRALAANIRNRIVLPEASMPAAEQAVAYSRAFELLNILNHIYELFVENLTLSRELGLDVAELESQLRGDLAERAANGSALLEMTMADVTTLRAGVSAVPGDAEVKARLNVATINVSSLANGLTTILAIMDSLGMDSTSYQEQLLVATGQLTTDVFEVGVFTNLLIGWGQTLWSVLIESGPGLFFKLILFFIIVFAFYKLAGLLQRLTEVGLAKSEVELSLLLRRMVVSIVRNTTLVIGVLIALSQVGISLGPLLAGLGVVGFVVGFALQDTLSNFAAGLLILVYRPFDVEDFIEAGGVSGMVSNMSLVNTTILTFDNQTIVVPNNKIWGDVIRNVTAQAIRRIDLIFGIGYADDIPKTEKLLQEIVSSHEAVLDEPETIIRVHELGDSSVNFIVRPWVNKDDYWETYWSITRTVKMRFDEEGISIPFPQRDVHLYNT